MCFVLLDRNGFMYMYIYTDPSECTPVVFKPIIIFASGNTGSLIEISWGLYARPSTWLTPSVRGWLVINLTHAAHSLLRALRRLAAVGRTDFHI